MTSSKVVVRTVKDKLTSFICSEIIFTGFRK